MTAPARGRGRRPGPSDTRAAIVAAARELFAEKGYEGASLRGIARAAGVDPALVHHYFGGKEGVFVEAMRFPVDPDALVPMIMAAPADRLGETMARIFFSVWEEPAHRAPILAMLRTALGSESGATMMRDFVTEVLFARVATLRDIPLLNVNLAVGHLVGVMVLRHVLGVEPLASADADELVERIAPSVQRYLG